MQYMDTFIAIGEDEYIYEYDPALERFKTRVGQLSTQETFRFGVITDGTLNECA